MIVVGLTTRKIIFTCFSVSVCEYTTNQFCIVQSKIINNNNMLDWLTDYYGIELILYPLDDVFTIHRPDLLADRTMAFLTMLSNKLFVPLAKTKNHESRHCNGIPRNYPEFTPNASWSTYGQHTENEDEENG